MGAQPAPGLPPRRGSPQPPPAPLRPGPGLGLLPPPAPSRRRRGGHHCPLRHHQLHFPSVPGPGTKVIPGGLGHRGSTLWGGGTCPRGQKAPASPTFQSEDPTGGNRGFSKRGVGRLVPKRFSRPRTFTAATPRLPHKGARHQSSPGGTEAGPAPTSSSAVLQLRSNHRQPSVRGTKSGGQDLPSFWGNPEGRDGLCHLPPPSPSGSQTSKVC